MTGSGRVLLRSRRGQNTVEYLMMLAAVVGVVLIVGVALKKYMPELFSKVTAPIQQKFFGGSGEAETASDSSGSGGSSGSSLSNLLPGSGGGSSAGAGATPGNLAMPSSGGSSVGSGSAGAAAAGGGGGDGAGGSGAAPGGASLQHYSGSDGAGTARTGGSADGGASPGGSQSSYSGGTGGAGPQSASAGGPGLASSPASLAGRTPPSRGGSSQQGPGTPGAPGTSPGKAGSSAGSEGQSGAGGKTGAGGLAGIAPRSKDEARMTDIATQAMGLAGTPEGSGPASAATWARLWERVGPADLVPPSDAGRVDKLVKLVGENKELQEAYRNWDKLAKEQRLGALRLIADLFADAYGIPKFELDSFEPAEKEERVLAFHRFDGRMMVNASALDDRDAAVSAVMHQGLHRYQDDLMAAVAAGRIGPDDDRYRLSFVLGANKTNYLGSQDYAAYRGQPIEGQAYLMEGVGAAALAALTGADAPPRVTLNRITRKAAVGMSVGPTGLLFPAYLLAAFLIVLAMVVIVFRAETGGLGPRTS